MIPQQIDQVEKGLGRVISSLQEKENFNKLLEIFLIETQQLEDENISLAEQKNLAIATGVWLDYIGGIVGEDRRGRTDVNYRSALSTRIGINTSDGTSDNVIALAKAHTNSTSSKIIDYHPAGFFSVVNGTEGLGTSLHALIEGTKPTAVSAIVVSNYTGNRFVPAWIDQSAFTTVEEALLLDGDELLLDDGLNPLDFLEVLVTPDNIYSNDATHSVLGWIDETTPSETTEIFLSQVITATTTKI